MSVVTTVLVSTGPESAHVDKALSAEIDGYPGFRLITGDIETNPSWGGNKRPQLRLWAGAFNYIDWDVLFAHIEGIAWREPDELQVLIGAEYSRKLGLYELQGQRLVPRNLEAALQMASFGVVDVSDEDDSFEPVRDAYRNVPTTEAEFAKLIDQVAAVLAPTSCQDLDRELRLLLSESGSPFGLNDERAKRVSSPGDIPGR
jgi:hypothetical protein